MVYEEPAPWKLPYSSKLLSVTTDIVRPHLVRHGCIVGVGEIERLDVTIRFVLHETIVLRRFSLPTIEQWEAVILPLRELARRG